MKFFVCQPKGQSMCKVWVSDNAEERVDLPFDTWAIRSGRQLLFIEREMPRLLKELYVGGSFHDGGATYLVTFEEMVMILDEKLGPNDRLRCEEAQKEFDAVKDKFKDLRKRLWKERWLASSNIALRLAGSLLYVVWLGMKFLVFVCIFPFFIMWVNKHKK